MKKIAIKIRFIALVALVISGIMLTGCKKDYPANNVIVITATGDITAKLNEFRNLAGPTLNSTTGVTGGRREINWDGVPDSLLARALPSDFFNPVGDNAPVARQRGIVYASADQFMVSKTGFSEINAEASTEFRAFSGTKTFTMVNANLWPVSFRVAGQDIEATVQSFGLVFSDVDEANTASVEYFSADKSLGKFFVPAHDASSSFSFLGVYFKNEKITKVQVAHEGILTESQTDISQGGPKDLVVLDDFIYSEPEAR